MRARDSELGCLQGRDEKQHNELRSASSASVSRFSIDCTHSSQSGVSAHSASMSLDDAAGRRPQHVLCDALRGQMGVLHLEL